jgi:hypothetical protein
LEGFFDSETWDFFAVDFWDFLGVGLGEAFERREDWLSGFDVDFFFEEEIVFDGELFFEEELVLDSELFFDGDFGLGRGLVEEDGLLTGLIVSRDLMKAAFFCASLISARRLDGSPQMQKRRTIKLMDFEVRTPKFSKPEFIFKTMRQLQIWGANSRIVSRRAR